MKLLEINLFKPKGWFAIIQYGEEMRRTRFFPCFSELKRYIEKLGFRCPKQKDLAFECWNELKTARVK